MRYRRLMIRLAPSLLMLVASTACLYISEADQEELLDGAYDLDGDGHRSLAGGGGDCDDADDSVHPDAAELCDGVDRNCDGVIDDDSATDAVIWFADVDQDGFGDPDNTIAACEQPEGYGSDDSDCNDADAQVNPEGVEACDEANADEDCDGLADDADPDMPPIGAQWWFPDDDQDTYGDMHDPGVALCEDGAASGLTLNHDDCDDGDDTTSPATGDCRLTGGTIDPGIFADATIRGPEVFSAVGSAVGSAGDQDGDGLNEVVIGAAAQARPDNGKHTGAVFIEHGWQAGNYTPGSDTVAILYGQIEDGAFGLVTDAHDLNQDGITDILVGAPNAESGGVPVGAAYLFNGPLEGTTMGEAANARIVGAPGFIGAGWGLDAVGDVDGDGQPDLLVAAFVLAQDFGEPASSYLIKGPLSGDYVLGSDEDAVFSAPEDERAGADIAGVGDLDGDGLTDVAVGAPTWRDPGAGALEAAHGRVYIVYGGFSTGTVPLPNADVILDGSSYQTVGSRLAAAGDFDGDGKDDLVIGAPFGGITLDPRVWVVPGDGLSSGPIGARSSFKMHFSSLQATLLGFSVSSGNFDGDGFSDIAFGSPGWNTEAGRAMVVYGGSTLTGVYLPGDIPGTVAGARFHGTQSRQGPANNPTNKGANLGLSVALVNDVNRDGRDDLLLGSPFHDISLSEQGAAFLFLGGQAP